MTDSSSLDRDQQILARLAKIEHKVDSIEQTNAFALRAEAKKHFAEVKKIFGNSVRRAQVYLAANGERSVSEIATHLGMQRQNVGPDLKYLAREGLLELVDSRGNQDIWAKKPLDRSLRITPFLCEDFWLSETGLQRMAGKPVKEKNSPDE
jgi:DNA-binding transcriptional ArsR family regulator